MKLRHTIDLSDFKHSGSNPAIHRAHSYRSHRSVRTNEWNIETAGQVAMQETRAWQKILGHVLMDDASKSLPRNSYYAGFSSRSRDIDNGAMGNNGTGIERAK